MQVRKAQEEDLDRIHRLICRNFDEVMAKYHSLECINKFKEYNSLESLTNQLQWKTMYVAEMADEIVGTGSLANLGVVGYPKYAVSNLFVAPEMHQKGIGTAIFKQLLEDAKRICTGELHVPSSRNALNFYLKLGFAVNDEQPEDAEEITWLTLTLA